MGGTVGKLDNLRESVQARIYCYGKPARASKSAIKKCASSSGNVQGASEQCNEEKRASVGLGHFLCPRAPSTNTSKPHRARKLRAKVTPE